MKSIEENKGIILKVFKNTDNYYLLRSDMIMQISRCMEQAVNAKLEEAKIDIDALIFMSNHLHDKITIKEAIKKLDSLKQ